MDHIVEESENARQHGSLLWFSMIPGIFSVNRIIYVMILSLLPAPEDFYSPGALLLSAFLRRFTSAKDNPLVLFHVLISPRKFDSY